MAHKASRKTIRENRINRDKIGIIQSAVKLLKETEKPNFDSPTIGRLLTNYPELTKTIYMSQGKWNNELLKSQIDKLYSKYGEVDNRNTGGKCNRPVSLSLYWSRLCHASLVSFIARAVCACLACLQVGTLWILG